MGRRISQLRSSWPAVVAIALFAIGGRSAADDTDPQGLDFFERKIRPLLARRCYECHSQARAKAQGGLQLDALARLLAGGDSGPAVVPGKPDESLLITAVRHADGLEMPPEGRLPAGEIDLLTEWVERGAPMPHGGPSTGSGAKRVIDYEAGRGHWAFQPLEAIEPPSVAGQAWVRRPIDAFVLAALESRKLSPSPPADRRTLLRRVSFDLVGLPPTADEIEAFEHDDSADAFDRVVDRLLASPRYGERWGRYWLDLARYSDTPAPWEADVVKGQAWLYRDWVVEALNADMPYDEFVRRQLAADHLAAAAPRDRAALGFLGVSPVHWKELKLDKELIKGIVADEWEERIDAIGRTFLGLSLACARCHDHKYDPIGAEDYYALAGVLASTQLVDVPIIPDAEARAAAEARATADALKAEVRKIEAAKPRPDDAESRLADLRERIVAAERTPHYHTPIARGATDAAVEVSDAGPGKPQGTRIDHVPGKAIDVCLQIRGSPSNPGPVVPRRFLTVLSATTPRPFRNGSGRLDLADAIVGDAAPLAARVIVNRVWKHHFGRGLVDTASDFGVQGEAPSHPDLLTDLAHRFVAGGWSLKWLHREILHSATYAQSSRSDPAGLATDPDDAFYWRMPRRRLDIEAWRDAMLAVAGTLDERLGGPPEPLAAATNHRRTIYGLIDRYAMDDMLRLHDFPDSFTHSPLRVPTITPLQQLFVLNGPFVQRQAAALATRIAGAIPDAAAVPDRIRVAYRFVFGRPPNERERRRGETFLLAGDPQAAPGPEAWARYAQVLLGTNEFLFID